MLDLKVHKETVANNKPLPKKPWSPTVKIESTGSGVGGRQHEVEAPRRYYDEDSFANAYYAALNASDSDFEGDDGDDEDDDDEDDDNEDDDDEDDDDEDDDEVEDEDSGASTDVGDLRARSLTDDDDDDDDDENADDVDYGDDEDSDVEDVGSFNNRGQFKPAGHGVKGRKPSTTSVRGSCETCGCTHMQLCGTNRPSCCALCRHGDKKCTCNGCVFREGMEEATTDATKKTAIRQEKVTYDEAKKIMRQYEEGQDVRAYRDYQLG